MRKMFSKTNIGVICLHISMSLPFVLTAPTVQFSVLYDKFKKEHLDVPDAQCLFPSSMLINRNKINLCGNSAGTGLNAICGGIFDLTDAVCHKSNLTFSTDEFMKVYSEIRLKNITDLCVSSPGIQQILKAEKCQEVCAEDVGGYHCKLYQTMLYVLFNKFQGLTNLTQIHLVIHNLPKYFPFPPYATLERGGFLSACEHESLDTDLTTLCMEIKNLAVAHGNRSMPSINTFDMYSNVTSSKWDPCSAITTHPMTAQSLQNCSSICNKTIKEDRGTICRSIAFGLLKLNEIDSQRKIASSVHHLGSETNEKDVIEEDAKKVTSPVKIALHENTVNQESGKESSATLAQMEDDGSKVGSAKPGLTEPGMKTEESPKIDLVEPDTKTAEASKTNLVDTGTKTEEVPNTNLVDPGTNTIEAPKTEVVDPGTKAIVAPKTEHDDPGTKTVETPSTNLADPGTKTVEAPNTKPVDPETKAFENPKTELVDPGTNTVEASNTNLVDLGTKIMETPKPDLAELDSKLLETKKTDFSGAGQKTGEAPKTDLSEAGTKTDEAPKTDLSEAGTKTVEAPKTYLSEAGTKTVEAPKTDLSEAGTKTVEAPKTDLSEAGIKTVEAPKTDLSEAGTKTVEAPKTDLPEAGTKTGDAPKTDLSEAGTKTVEAPKTDLVEPGTKTSDISNTNIVGSDTKTAEAPKTSVDGDLQKATTVDFSDMSEEDGENYDDGYDDAQFEFDKSRGKAPSKEDKVPSQSKTANEEQHYVPEKDEVEPAGISFMSYFLVFLVLCVAGYIVFHNKQKIIALVIEGKSNPNGRRPSSKEYRRLKTDDVMPSLEKSASGSNYVY